MLYSLKVKNVSWDFSLGLLSENDLFFSRFLRAEVMQARISHEPDVIRPSVRPFVKRVDRGYDKTKKTCAHILVLHERSFILVF